MAGRAVGPEQSPPSAISSGVMPVVSYCSSVGMAGPGANEAMYAASAAVSSAL